MSNKMKAYTIAIENKGGNPTDRCTMTFLEKIRALFTKDNLKAKRDINKDTIMINDFVWRHIQDVHQKDYVVIPFGKLKPETKKPYRADPADNIFKGIDGDLYDVNYLAYHKRHNIALLTTSNEGPRWNAIENYLTTFLAISERKDYQVCLRPISMLNDLQKIRQADSVRDIKFTMNLGRPLDNFFAGKQAIKENKSVLEGLQGMLAMGKVSKELLRSDVFTFKMCFDRESGRKANLNLDAIIELIDFINWDVDCIKEIEVKYKSGGETKPKTARLRNSEFDSDIEFPSSAKERMAGEYIVNNMDDVLRDNITRFRGQIDTYFKGQIELGDDYEVQEEFDGTAPVA
ncbi:MAG: hypothetical protein FWE21_00455 [Defluviitaleaceae bacterium]|nr:hypothetical protein [Defluviitaleaceae bacterium]